MSATNEVTTWKIDPSHSLVEFSARHMMITRVKGRLAAFEGKLTIDETDPGNSTVSVDFDASSIDTRSEQRDEHLRSADFLDVANHPGITFRSTAIKGAGLDAGSSFTVTGDLTIRGVTRPVTLKVEAEGRGTDPWGGERISFTASGRIVRSDFGLTWNAALESGGVLVSDEIGISIEVQAVRE